jgi:hypothetical protein
VDTKSISNPSQSSAQTPRRFALALAGFAVLIIAAFVLYAYLGGARKFAERQRHALQSAAEMDLKDLAKKENEFHERHGTYTTDLFALGIAPKSVIYKFGFVTPAAEQLPDGEIHVPARKDLDALKSARPELNIKYSSATKLDEITFDQLAPYCPDCTATVMTFKAIAAANLDDDPDLDIWTIDQSGALRHIVDDLGSSAGN